MEFRIDRVYTRVGDFGETLLIGGKRVSKSCQQVECYGTVDELNSALGLANEFAINLQESLPGAGPARVGVEEIVEIISVLQQELFDIGAELAVPLGLTYEGAPVVRKEQVEFLERLCDGYSQRLPALTSFIVPGGGLAASQLHVARTISRRAEREVVRFFEENAIAFEEKAGELLEKGAGKSQSEDRFNGQNAEVIKYLNRLSDLLFLLARQVSFYEGRDCPLWRKACERPLPRLRELGSAIDSGSQPGSEKV